MHTNEEETISEEIPIELLQRGVKISDKEMLEHDYLILEVKFNYILGNRGKFIKWQQIKDKRKGINHRIKRRTGWYVLFRNR